MQSNRANCDGTALAEFGSQFRCLMGADLAPIAARERNGRKAMLVLAGAAQHVLGALGSLQQTAASVQNASSSSTSDPFSLGSLAQGANSANPGTSGTGTWWSNPGTMNALLSAQDLGSQDSGNDVGTSSLAAPTSGHHGGGHHSPIGGNQQNADQNTDGIGATTGSTTSSAPSFGPSGGIGGLVSNLFNQQMMSGSASIGQSLSTLV
jgi:hypothetical protein